jgi:thioesterase domain-containing protein
MLDLARAAGNLIRIVRGTETHVFDGDVLFVTAQRSRPGRRGGSELWQEYVNGTIADHDVDCGHFEMMKPEPLAAIGALISDRLVLR